MSLLSRSHTGTQHPPLPSRSLAPTISSLLNGNTSFGAAAAAAAAAPSSTGTTHAAGGAAAPGNGVSGLVRNGGAAAAAAAAGGGGGTGAAGCGDGGGCGGGHTAVLPPRKCMGLLEAMDAISDGEERRCTQVFVWMCVTDRAVGGQWMPSQRGRRCVFVCERVLILFAGAMDGITDGKEVYVCACVRARVCHHTVDGGNGCHLRWGGGGGNGT
eukprot:1147540-Pelagomonas_calceolata.AAC.3